MPSLMTFASILAVGWIATAWLLGRSAKAVGSSRGRFAVGLFAIGLLIVVNLALVLLGEVIPIQDAKATIAMNLALLVAQIYLSFVILQRLFDLSAKRALAPFGAYLFIAMLQLGFALVVVRPSMIESFHLPTEGMSPTIEAGQRFFANKMIEPRRLDLVVYWNNSDPPLPFCQRLIAMPGERLRFEDGSIFINDKLIDLPEVLCGRCRAKAGGRGPYRDRQTIELGSDEYFFIGDNVEKSADSRMYGPARPSAIIGVVDLIYWPFNKARIIR